MFSVALLFEFTPGHVDHHGLVIILILGRGRMYVALIEQPDDSKPALAAGLILAFALMIALECLPWALLLAAGLASGSMRQGDKAARSGAVFAGAFLIGNVFCLR